MKVWFKVAILITIGIVFVACANRNPAKRPDDNLPTFKVSFNKSGANSDELLKELGQQANLLIIITPPDKQRNKHES